MASSDPTQWTLLLRPCSMPWRPRPEPALGGSPCHRVRATSLLGANVERAPRGKSGIVEGHRRFGVFSYCALPNSCCNVLRATAQLAFGMKNEGLPAPVATALRGRARTVDRFISAVSLVIASGLIRSARVSKARCYRIDYGKRAVSVTTNIRSLRAGQVLPSRVRQPLGLSKAYPKH